MTTRRAAAQNGETDSATGSRNRSNALNAFLAAKCEIDGILARLTALSADHFETSPDEINWGTIGTFAHHASLLRQITDSAFKEGEHAE